MPEKPTVSEPKPSSFAIASREVEGIPVFAISGYCAADAAHCLGDQVEALLQTKRTPVIWDFSACKLVNSPGVVVLMDIALRVVDDFQCALVITGVDETQASVFRMVGVFPVAQFAPTLAEALRKAVGG